MTKSRKISLLLFGSTLFIYGCSSHKVPVTSDRFIYHGIYFGKNINTNTQYGIVDGCTTAKGDYRKSHTLFNNNNDYYKGWFLGRQRCKYLLRLDKNGDIIL